MVDKTRFELEVPTSEIRYEKEFQDPTSTSSEGKPILAPNYQLTFDKVRSKIVSFQRYNYVDLICYALNG